MEDFKFFFQSIRSFRKTTAKEATSAMLDIPVGERKERIKDVCNIYNRYTFFLANYRGLNDIDLNNEIQVFKFRSLIGWSFNTEAYGATEITKEIYTDALSTAVTNSNNIHSEFSKLVDWKPTPKAEIIPDWLPPLTQKLFAPTDTRLIFDDQILFNLYRECNGVFINPVDIDTFKNYFRVIPLGKPTFKKGGMTEFCGLLGMVEEKRKEGLIPNFDNWIKQIGINTYKTLKSRKNK